MIFDWPLRLAYGLVLAGLVIGAVNSRRYRWVFGGFAIALASVPVLYFAFLVFLFAGLGGRAGF